MNKYIELLTKQPYKLKETILDGPYTKTTHFLLPGLHISNNLQTFTKYFVNAFIDDEEITHIIKNPVFVLCKTKAFDADWLKFETALKSSPRCIYDYIVGKFEDDYLVMFLFEFPPAYRADYFKFIEGEYSQFSEQYKKLFIEKLKDDNGTEKENSLYGIIHKTQTFKHKLEKIIDERLDPQKEYWEKWSVNREIFRKKEKA